ncbi:MAG: large repetitive protein, partial [Actinomycetota bacterium]|nr:large repetitive protein [Actinomycetota bacterium]
MSVTLLAGTLLLAMPAQLAFAASAPMAPTIGTATRGPGSASVTFRLDSDGGAHVSSFAVACTSLNGGASASATGTASPIVVSALTNGKTYTCRVTATNAIGTSPPSNPSNMFVPVTTPGAPTALSALPGSTSATVQWTAPLKNGGAAVTGYVVTPFLAGAAQPVQTFDTTATMATVTDLTNRASYTFTVAAKNVAGTGAPSAATSPILIGLPIGPTNVVASASPGTALVAWQAPRADGGAAITGYVVTPYEAGVAQSPRVFTSPKLSQRITGLTNRARYTFIVAASNVNGTGLSSGSMAPITVGSRKPPTAPTALAAAPGNGHVVLTWAAPSDSGSASVTRYLVTPYVGGVAGPVRTYDTGTKQLVAGLTNGTTYQFTVVAGNAAGTSPPSAMSGSVTAGAPTAPRSVSAVPGSGGATVSWNAPASDNGRALTGYVITPSVGTLAQTPIVVGVTTSRVVGGLAHSKIYTFRVAAKNANGIGPQSAASNAVRPNTMPVATADAYTTNEDTP